MSCDLEDPNLEGHLVCSDGLPVKATASCTLGDGGAQLLCRGLGTARVPIQSAGFRTAWVACLQLESSTFEAGSSDLRIMAGNDPASGKDARMQLVLHCSVL